MFKVYEEETHDTMEDPMDAAFDRYAARQKGRCCVYICCNVNLLYVLIDPWSCHLYMDYQRVWVIA